MEINKDWDRVVRDQRGHYVHATDSTVEEQLDYVQIPVRVTLLRFARILKLWSRGTGR